MRVRFRSVPSNRGSRWSRREIPQPRLARYPDSDSAHANPTYLTVRPRAVDSVSFRVITRHNGIQDWGGLITNAIRRLLFG